MTSAAARRAALLALFFVTGVLLSSWVTRTPDVRDLLGASTAEMGLVLFGLSVGSMIGVLGSGPFVTRFGARPVITADVSSLHAPQAAGAVFTTAGRPSAHGWWPPATPQTRSRALSAADPEIAWCSLPLAGQSES